MAQGKFKYRIDINAKPEDVFAYISDLAKHTEWNEGLTIEKVSEGEVAGRDLCQELVTSETCH